MKSQPISKAAKWSAVDITTMPSAVFCVVTARNKADIYVGRNEMCRNYSDLETTLKVATTCGEIKL